MEDKKVQLSGLKKKKVTPLSITEDDLKIETNDLVCVPEHIATLLVNDDRIPMKRSEKVSMKKKKSEPLEIIEDDLSLHTTDVLILPGCVYDILHSKGDPHIKITPEQLLIMKEKQLVMTGIRQWTQSQMSRRFLRKGPKLKVWKIPGIHRGPLNYIHLSKLPLFWHKFMKHQAKLRRYKTMPTANYGSLFLHQELKGPVKFVSSTGALKKAFDNSIPTVALCWTRGEHPQVVDYAVYGHQELNRYRHSIEETKKRITNQNDGVKRLGLKLLIISIRTTEATKQLFFIVKKRLTSLRTMFSISAEYFVFKFRHQVIPITFLALSRFLRAHIDFVLLMLHALAHVTRWVKRSVRPLNL